MKAFKLSFCRFFFGLFCFTAILAHLTTPGYAQQKLTLTDEQVDLVKWRSIGPASMGGRITALAVCESDPSTWWAASASGGLLKTTNNGTTFEHQFDDQPTVSIGDVQVAQSDPNIVWVGTGEANPRNSVSWGDGVYKSTDGGKTWKNMGLKNIFQTGRIAIHPKNPDIVYVGALGRLWGPSEDRGLYKTTDGGETWEKILYVDDKTGVIDVQMNMSNPEHLIVATYERQRDGFDGNDPMKKYGDGSAIYVTKNGGKKFTKSVKGLPSVKLGRVGLSVYRKDPKYVYAIIESEKISKEPEDAAYAGIQGQNGTEVGAKLTRIVEKGPAEAAGLQVDDIVIRVNDEYIHSYNSLQSAIRKNSAGDKATWVVARDGETVELEVKYTKMPEGNNRRRSPFTGTLGGQSANSPDEQGKKGADYGGIYMSKDFGKSWTRINTLNPRPMYYSQIRVDPSDNNYLYVCGTSLYRSSDGGTTWKGDGGGGGVDANGNPRASIHVDHHALYIDPNDGRHMILGCDGGIHVTHDRMDHWDHLNHVAIGQFYHVGVGPNKDYHVYGGLQDNGSWGAPVRAVDDRLVNSDWYRVGGGDGFITLVDPNDKDQIYYESQNGSMGTTNFRTGERQFMRPQRERGSRIRYRFNWKTPFILSPHNSKVHYSAGNYVFRTAYKGNGMTRISPEITNTDNGSGSAISESPAEQGVVYVGTTDGAVWVTRDGGNEWTPIFVQKEKKEEAKDEQPADKKPAEEKSPSDQEKKVGKTSSNNKNKKEAAIDDKLTGTWNGTITSDELPGGSTDIIIELKMNKSGQLGGMLSAPDAPGDAGEIEIIEGNFNSKTQKLYFLGQSGGFEIDAEATLKKNRIEGNIEINGEITVEFSAERDKSKKTQDPDDKTAEKKPAAEKSKPSKQEDEDKDKEADDPVSGSWEGKLISERMPSGSSELSMTLSRDEKGNITGSYDSQRGDREISEGNFDAKTGKITLVSDNLEFIGKIQKNTMTGEVDFGGGRFQMEFEVKRTSAAASNETVAETESDQEKSTLGKLVPGPRWVSSLEASRFGKGRCYMTLDGHRSNDDEPYVLMTEDYGKTWKSIRANLPTSAGSTRVIREDLENENLLYLGCEFSAWVSVDRGQSWTRLNGGLPTVAVHEFALHPSADEVVAGTHGRSLWVADVSALRQMTAENLSAKFALFQPKEIIRWRNGQSRGESGTRRFVGENGPRGTSIVYSLGQNARSISLEISDVRGNVIHTFDSAPATQGVHALEWNLRRSGGGNRRFGGQNVATGNYLVTLTVDGDTQRKTLSIVQDPNTPIDAVAEDEELNWLLEMSEND